VRSDRHASQCELVVGLPRDATTAAFGTVARAAFLTGVQLVVSAFGPAGGFRYVACHGRGGDCILLEVPGRLDRP
jgi:hypothetical protein